MTDSITFRTMSAAEVLPSKYDALLAWMVSHPTEVSSTTYAQVTKAYSYSAMGNTAGAMRYLRAARRSAHEFEVRKRVRAARSL